jgi:hypothetical protein
MLKTRTVYLISSMQTDKIYIGSTYQSLNQRLSQHKYQNNTSKEITKFGDVKIEWLCTKQKCTQKEIELYEREFILLFKDICVNILGTKDSYSKEYKNPAMLDGRYHAQRKIKNVCSICDGKYTNANKSRHLKSKQHLENLL